MAGIVQLVSKGLEDKYIIGNPKITNFKFVYKRVSNFAREIQRNTFSVEPNFNSKYTCTISKSGDMLNRMALTFTLPEINENIEFMWVKKVAFVIVKSIELEIGSVLVDKHYGDWLNIWYEISLPLSKRFDKYIGLDNILNSYSKSKSEHILYIPLTFWFNTFSKMALPLICLKNQDIKINVDFNDINECIKTLPTNCIKIKNSIVPFLKNDIIYQKKDNKIVSKGIFHDYDITTNSLYCTHLKGSITKENGSIYNEHNSCEIEGSITNTCANVDFTKYKLKNVYILCEYIFLDKDEKALVVEKANGDHLIEQTVYGDEKVLYEKKNDIPVRFLGLCKELFWVVQKESSKLEKDYFNYSTRVKKEHILVNSIKRQIIMDSKYYTLLQPYIYHTHTNDDTSIHNFSFSLYPEKINPSGIINLQKISNFNFKIVLNTKKRNQINYFRSYAKMYNIFRISDGYGSVVFNNITT